MTHNTCISSGPEDGPRVGQPLGWSGSSGDQLESPDQVGPGRAAARAGQVQLVSPTRVHTPFLQVVRATMGPPAPVPPHKLLISVHMSGAIL